MGTKRQPTLAQQLQKAIRDADETPNQIGIQAGVDPSVMSRFVNNDRGISLRIAGRLAKYLGLELQPARKPRRKAGS